MPQHNFHTEYTFDFYQGLTYFGRPEPFNPDFSRLPYCECGESFLLEIRERYGTLLDYPTLRGLDEAILTISLEYAERLKTLPEHPLNSCVPEVFAEVLGLLSQKRDKLLRHPKRAQQAHLSVGVEAGKNQEEAE
jgi:hypothetical protein